MHITEARFINELAEQKPMMRARESSVLMYLVFVYIVNDEGNGAARCWTTRFYNGAFHTDQKLSSIALGNRIILSCKYQPYSYNFFFCLLFIEIILLCSLLQLALHFASFSFYLKDSKHTYPKRTNIFSAFLMPAALFVLDYSVFAANDTIYIPVYIYCIYCTVCIPFSTKHLNR